MSRADRRQANLAVFRDQEAELEKEKAAGTLGEADYQQAREELQRRLLEEVDVAAEAVSPRQGPSRPTAIVLALLLPAAALLGYTLLGNPKALDPRNLQAQPQVTAEQINDMVGKLAARMKDNPDDEKGWIMLARSYKTLGRLQEAADAYAKGGKLLQENAALLTDYAETLASLSEGRFAGKPTQLINQALKLNPEEPQALILAGVAAGEREDYKAAIGYWERLLPMVEPGSEEETSLKEALARLREKAEAQPGKKAARK
ncbi:MAG: c-type cytochrome biogenesis protein CcmI [Azospira oryzae]|nr:MAG: c-type cytochrome biogenesis protein CcmI [Azospira oryzae]